MDLAKAIEANRDQAVRTLKELIQIKSDAGDPVTSGDGDVYPFGQGVQDAFAYMLSKAEEYGFATENIDNYGGHIDFGEGRETIGILGHLDVVPAGEGWAFEPYAAEEADGYLYGRGTTDDKGPLLAAFYAMKALKDAGYEPARRIRLILGLDEEKSWKGMHYYLEHVPAPDFGFTPDGEFPVVNGEKGMLEFEIARKLAKGPAKGLALTRLSGGEATNVVAEHARAVVKSETKATYDSIREEAAAYREATGRKIRIKGVGKSLEITTEGKNAHAAQPDEGLNAIAILFDFLGRLNFANEDVNEFIDFYNRYIGFNVHGEKLEVDFSDEESGRLSMNNGLVRYDRDSVSVSIDIRYPVTFTEEQIFDTIMPVLDQYGLGVVKNRSEKPLYFSADSNLIRTLMDVYREKTGDTENGPIVMGGGTYAKAAPGIVAFGGLFPGDEDRMHQKNERITLDRYFQMIEIYAETIYRLSQEDFVL